MVQTWISFSAPPVDQFLRERTQHDISISCNIIFHFVFPLPQQLEQLSCHVATRCSILRSFYPQSMKTCRMSSCVSILRCDASALSPFPPPRACMNTGLPRLPASSTCKRSARCIDHPQSRLLCNPFVRRTPARVDRGEHFLRLLLLDTLPQRRRCCHLLLILHVHPAAPDHRRILRASQHRCEEQNVRAPPVIVCFIWIWICDTVVSSRPACSLKVSKSQARLGILTETTLAHTSLCVGDHLLQCSGEMCLRKTDIPFASGHAKRAAVSVFSSLSHALTELENIGFTHRTLVGKRHRRGMQLQSVRATPKQGCVPQAQLQPHVIHKNSVHLFSSFRPTSVLVRFVCFLLSHSAVFTARS